MVLPEFPERLDPPVIHPSQCYGERESDNDIMVVQSPGQALNRMVQGKPEDDKSNGITRP